MRVVVIGLGAMGLNHARIYSELGVLDAVYDVDQKKSEEVAKKYGCAWYINLQAILDSPPDAVSIATPTPTHAAIGEKCLEAGIHVLMEKPICDSVVNATNLVETAFRNKVILAVGYIERFNPVYRALQKLVIDKAFGEITSINVKRVGGWPRTATNVIIDLMTHDFNLLYGLTGQSPDSISASSRVSGGVVDSAQVLLGYKWGSATCEANWVSPVKIRKIEVTGTQGYCEANLITQELTRYDTNLVKDNPHQVFENFHSLQSFVQKHGTPSCTTTAKFNKEPLKEELLVFLDAVKTGYTGEIVTGKEALETLVTTLKAAKERN